MLWSSLQSPGFSSVFDPANPIAFFHGIRGVLPFVATWALMGLEPIGYAKANFKHLFFDHSKFPWPIINAIRISQLRNFNCQLYNIPRCTIPVEFRGHCTDSISDWKRKFLPECAECVEQDECCGFFEWYNEKSAWSGVSPILAVRGDIE